MSRPDAAATSTPPPPRENLPTDSLGAFLGGVLAVAAKLRDADLSPHFLRQDGAYLTFEVRWTADGPRGQVLGNFVLVAFGERAGCVVFADEAVTAELGELAPEVRRGG